MPTIATPTVLTDPGYLFRAPLGTAIPTPTVTSGKFTDAWPAAWVPQGATEDGSSFSWSTTVEPIRVAELFDPIKYATTEQSGTIAFSLTNWTLTNLKNALNGGTVTTTGTAGAELNDYEPPDPDQIVRCMIGWESLDGTVRLYARQCLNGGTVESAFRRAPEKALIPFSFNLERPASAKSFLVRTSGTTRA
jgi:hypothetical protein